MISLWQYRDSEHLVVLERQKSMAKRNHESSNFISKHQSFKSYSKYVFT